jgi:zinc transporter 9
MTVAPLTAFAHHFLEQHPTVSLPCSKVHLYVGCAVLLQMLLRIGIKKAQRQPNEIHPYGYARDQFIWPLISAVGIFCCGAGVSFVHGVTGLFEVHREIGDLYWNFVGEWVQHEWQGSGVRVCVSLAAARGGRWAQFAWIRVG